MGTAPRPWLAAVGATAAWLLLLAAGLLGFASGCVLGPCPVMPSIGALLTLAVVMAPAIVGATIVSRCALNPVAPAWPGTIVGGVGAVWCAALTPILVCGLDHVAPETFPARAAFLGGFLPLTFLASCLVALVARALEHRRSETG